MSHTVQALAPTSAATARLRATPLDRPAPQRLCIAVLCALATTCANAVDNEKTLDAVVISGSWVEVSPFDVPYSVDGVRLDSNDGLGMRVNVSEVLGSVPGVVVQNRQNYAQDLQISVRGFGARAAFGVRGVKLKEEGDEVISMSVLKHIDVTPEERGAYMKAANRIIAPDDMGAPNGDEEIENVSDSAVNLSDERYRTLLASEQLLLTVTNKGFGKRTSAYEYRVSGRGGQGVTNMALTEKNGGEVVATFPVTDSHQIMLVTDKGQLIRTKVENIRITGRSAQGVTIFKVGEGESVVSVAWLIQDEDENNGNTSTDTEDGESDDAEPGES